MPGVFEGMVVAVIRVGVEVVAGDLVVGSGDRVFVGVT